MDANEDTRRVAVLERDIGNGTEIWHYDLQDTENEEIARRLLTEPLAMGYEPVVDQNGGGWTITGFVSCTPAEDEGGGA